jgi:hypothetical protein
VLVAAAILFVAVATGGAFVYTSHSSPRGTARNSAQPDPASSPAQDGSTPGKDDSASEPGQPDTSPDASGDGGIEIGTAVSDDPSSSSVASFLGQYFAAINAHDYESYDALLGPELQQAETQEQFDDGYGSTVDSSETLVGISTAADGDLDAEVTFTSHQDPADSPDQSESCTDWDISLFLAQGGGSGYLVDPAPSDYHASYQPCS